MNIKLVNNTGSDIRMFDAELLQAVETGVLPEELQDVFILQVIEVEGEKRGILNFA